MSKMKNFVAFRALVASLEEHGKEELIDLTYQKCKAELEKADGPYSNPIQELYNQFSYQEVSDKICEIITPKNIKPEIKIIYQTVEDLNASCPNHLGDWYFSGNYPTPGGMKTVNKAFVNYVENIQPILSF